MKKTYDRKFFRQKLLSEKKTVTAVSRLLIILLLGFPLLTRAGTSGSSRGEIDPLSGTSTRQDSVVATGKPGNQKLGFYEGEVMDTEGNPLPRSDRFVERDPNGYFYGHARCIPFPGNKGGENYAGLLVYRDETGGKGRDSGKESDRHDGRGSRRS